MRTHLLVRTAMSLFIVVALLLGGCAKEAPPATPLPTPVVDSTPIGAEATATKPAPGPTLEPVAPPAPRLVAAQPARGQEQGLGAPVILAFNQTMDRASVERAIAVSPAVPGRFTWDDPATVRFVPEAAYRRGTEYTVTVGSEARSAQGLPLPEPTQVRFRTVGALQIADLYPQPEATDVPVDAVLRVIFDRPVVPLTGVGEMGDLPAALALSPAVEGTGAWVNTSIYTLTPTEPLRPGTRYRVTIAAGLTGTTGALLEEDYAWEFVTAPPQVAAAHPAHGAQHLSPQTVVTITFAQPMDRGVTESLFSLRDAQGAAVAGRFTWDDYRMTFRPAAPLTKGGRYTARLEPGSPAAGSTASGAPELAQTIATELTIAFSVIDVPRVVSFSPQGGGVSPSASLQITFSSPMRTETLAEGLTISPQATHYVWWRDSDTVAVISAEFRPATTYTVTLDRRILGLAGDPLAEPRTFTFQTGDLSPTFSLDLPFETGSYNAYGAPAVRVLSTNAERIDTALYRLPLDDWLVLSDRYRSWQALDRYQPSQADLVNRWSDQPTAGRNAPDALLRPLSGPDGAPLPPGGYYLEVSSPGIRGVQKQVMTISRLNLTIKSGGDAALIWAVDLQGGAPVRGLELVAVDEANNELARARTDSDGIATMSYGSSIDPWQPMFFLAEEEGGTSVHLREWSSGIQAWDHGMPYEPLPGEHRGLLYTDRNIYRPGQTVYYRGILRADDDGRYSLLPPGTEVEVSVNDSEGRQILRQQMPVSDMGTLHGELLLTDDAALGYYGLSVQLDDGMFSTWFTVAEYRKPEFEVTLSLDADEYVHGETIEASALASYYFGGPVADADVRWRVTANPFYYYRWSGEGWYSFTDYDYYDPEAMGEYGRMVAEGTARTDPEGRFAFEVPADLSGTKASQTFSLEVSVTDLNNQEVSASRAAVVHRGEFYTGLEPAQYVGVAGEPQAVRVLTLDTQGAPHPLQAVEIVYYRQEWLSVRQAADDGRYYWTTQVRQTEVATDRVTTDAAGRALSRFTPAEGGSYRGVARAVDTQGNEVRSATYLWISGTHFVPWIRESHDRISLVADARSYRPGDTAHILVPSPFEGPVTALVTIERGSVLEHRVMTMATNSEQIDVPITADHLPNVFVSVVLVKAMGAEGEPAEIKVGYVQLPVSADEQALQVRISAGRDTYAPGDTATFDVEALDHAGRGVEAEFSLKLVDRAVEALMGPDRFDLMDTFYGQRGLGVGTAATLVASIDRHVLRTSPGSKGGGGGDDGGPRREFADTAFWVADLRTGSDGRASVSVPLPDNLTSWRMAGHGITSETLVGSADAVITTTLELMVRPAVPRFLVVGDEPEIATVVHNNTDRALDLVVRLAAEGLRLQSAEQRLSVPAQGRERLSWPAVVEDVTEVTLHLSASGGGLADAVQVTLPIHRPTTPETVGTAGVVTDQTVEVVRLPAQVDRSAGELTVTLEPSLAAGLREGLRYLESFPYECVEQTVSRFLPNVVTLAALRSLGIEQPDLAARLPDLVGLNLQRLYRGQNVDGGWGWWSQQSSSPLISAYVLFGLSEAQAAGHSVDPYTLRMAVKFLYEWLGSASRTAGSQDDLHATVLHALAMASEGDLGRTIALYDRRDNLSQAGTAYLALALAALDPEEPSRLATLASELSGSAILSASGAHWEEEAPNLRAMDSTARTTALTLAALVRTDPENPLLPNVVRWLMAVRTEGRWKGTQENVWSILALTDYMLLTGELNPDYDYALWLNGERLQAGHAEAARVAEAIITRVAVAGLDPLGDNQLVMERNEGPGRLYYSASLSYYVPAEEIQALNRGIIVSRSYSLIEDEEERPVAMAQANDTLQVKLTIIAPHDLHYLVVEDPLPAGVEALDTQLLTTSGRYEDGMLQRMPLDKSDPYHWYYYRNWADRVELRDDRTVLFAEYLPRGTYEYVYTVRCTTPGRFQALPTTAQLMYFADVFGRSDGAVLTIAP